MFLIMSVCLLAAPTTCKTERVEQSVEERPPLSCIVEGPSAIAIWQNSHPAWHVERWKCVPRSRLDTEL